MKITISLLFILILSFVSFGQTRRAPVKPKPAPTPETKAEKLEVKPTQKVIVEKLNGDRLTGLLVGADSEIFTIQISGANLPVKLNEIKTVWFGEIAEIVVVENKPNYIEEALKSLRKLAAATDVGVNFQDYGRRVIDVKAEVEEFLTNIPDGDSKTEIGLAMQAYADAGTAWNFAVQNRGYLFIDFEPAITLRPKYNLPTTRLGSLTLISNEVALSTIWATARKHIDNAQKNKP